jgi:hypothetical protein
MASITLDVAYDAAEDFPNLINEIQFEFEVKATVVRWVGPGGGWPEIKFEGDEANLRRLFTEKFDNGLADFELDE